ncbi:myelin-associated glycoprotein-like isoform X3 [Trematomus bernacchii]|uniref:myelin-associated glycoprotein-like isoform X3 n=1 Tax=Trematomus bernacchii TaxID=40690 RepID=UPI00146A33E7|nr:myelin-associated glycoprotein-like isoform X3 [Trematomus bernacchii]
MAGALKVFLLLLQGSLCLTFEITMPLRIEGLTGSCVKVPCTFDFDSQYDVNLDDSCKAIWMRGSTAGTVVFDSSLTGDQASRNILQGNLTGNLQNKECTTIFYNMPPSHSDNYYFRIECNGLKYHFPTGVRITTQNSLDQPTITPSTLEVEEGALVTLSCTAVAPCPILPPGLTWTPRIGDIEEKHESESMVSVMNFTSSYLHNGQNFSCTAVYKRQAGNTDLRFEKFMTLHVLYPPKTTSVSYSATVKEGSLVNLTCNGNANPAVYTWYKVNGGQVTDVGSGKRFSTTVSEVDRHFYCKVSNRYGTQNSSITQIDVQFPPKETAIIIEPKGPLLEGSSVSLLCKSRANPPVTNYTWYKGDEEEKEAGSSLVLNDVKPSSSGDYYCVAENEHGDQNSTLIRLDIQFPPKETAIIIEPKGPLLEGSSVSLLCKSQANPPVTNYTWYKGDEEEKEAGSSLVLNYVKPSSSGDYYCVAENEHGDQNSTLIRLDIQFPPKETAIIIEPKGPLLEGSSVSLLCNSRANPPVTNYTWYKGDEEEKDAGSSLVLNNVKPSSSGDYYCEAKNEHGDQNSTLIQLDIQYLPKNTSVSVDPSGPVQDGSSVTLTCTSIANPAAVNFTWFRAAGIEEKVMGSERDLTFNVTKLSEDQYYCEALNVHGPGTSEHVSFDVTFPPEILSSSRCIKISSMIRCSCYSQGNPPPSLVWKLAGEPVNHSAAITIREESLGNVGMKSIITLYDLDEDTLSLVCLSINSLGFDSFAFNMSLSKGLHLLSFGIGFVVAALGMLLVGVPLLIIYYRRGKVISSSDKGKAETCNPVVTDVINSSKVDVIYANKAFLEEKDVAEEEPLHYVNVYFAKLQAHSKGKPGEEIRGLDSKTEYAEIRLQSRGNIGGDAEEEENVSDTQLEQEKTP